MVLTPEDIKLLKELKAAGERGRTIHAFNTRLALQRLAKGGYVIARIGDDGLVNYRIAKPGRRRDRRTRVVMSMSEASALPGDFRSRLKNARKPAGEEIKSGGIE